MKSSNFRSSLPIRMYVVKLKHKLKNNKQKFRIVFTLPGWGVTEETALIVVILVT